MSKNGQSISQLFGYFLGEQIPGKKIKAICLQRYSKFRINYEEMSNLITAIWPDIGKYERMLPVLYKILKEADGNISSNLLDVYIEVIFFLSLDLPKRFK